MNLEELGEQARNPYGFPPFMRVKPVLECGVWPLSRTALFEALKRKKFHSFLLKDDLARSGVRLIEIASMLRYLAHLSSAAKKENMPAQEHREARPAKRKGQRREAALR
jgi:hypothetical protein